MAAVFADAARVIAAMEEAGSAALNLSIAALNTPQRTVVAGRRDAIQHLAARLEAEGVATVVLPISHAFHSRLM